jgi:hypothetical protein
VSEGKTIDTAPDSGNVLVIGGWRVFAEIACADGSYWRRARKEGSRAVPTHWMPVPQPPQTGDSE